MKSSASRRERMNESHPTESKMTYSFCMAIITLFEWVSRVFDSQTDAWRWQDGGVIITPTSSTRLMILIESINQNANQKRILMAPSSVVRLVRTHDLSSREKQNGSAIYFFKMTQIMRSTHFQNFQNYYFLKISITSNKKIIHRNRSIENQISKVNRFNLLLQ